MLPLLPAANSFRQKQPAPPKTSAKIMTSSLSDSGATPMAFCWPIAILSVTGGSWPPIMQPAWAPQIVSTALVLPSGEPLKMPVRLRSIPGAHIWLVQSLFLMHGAHDSIWLSQLSHPPPTPNAMFDPRVKLRIVSVPPLGVAVAVGVGVLGPQPSKELDTPRMRHVIGTVPVPMQSNA